MSVKQRFLQFYNGNKMPVLGLGTFLSKPNEVEEAVKYAIEIGYRCIDTAYYYKNEVEVGRAIRSKIEDGTVKRDDIFITTKLWNTFHKEEQVVPACKKSLENLGLDYVDLYLIHFPIAFQESEEYFPKNSEGKILTSDVDYLETWQGMEKCFELGLARNIGISNFNSEQIKRLIESARIKPVNNQIELNININQKKLRDFCRSQSITVTSYSSLGRVGVNPAFGDSDISNFLENPKLIEFGKKYGKTAAQVALRFVVELDAAVVPKSVTKSRIKENSEIFDFQLTEEEIKALESLETGKRLTALNNVKEHKYYPFCTDF